MNETGTSFHSLPAIGDRIRERREARSLTQRDLASALQMSAQAVSKWERGENAPDVATLVQLGRLLGVTTDWLLGAHREASDLFEGTVLVSDISGFSARIEQLGIRDAVAWVNGRLFLITEGALKYDAVPVHYLGDSFFCFFAGSEHRERAIGAALHMRRLIAEPVRIGLGSGQICYCTIGHPDYAGKSLEGDAVRLAARAEGWARGHTKSLIAATESVVAGLQQTGQGAYTVGAAQEHLVTTAPTPVHLRMHEISPN